MSHAIGFIRESNPSRTRICNLRAVPIGRVCPNAKASRYLGISAAAYTHTHCRTPMKTDTQTKLYTKNCLYKVATAANDRTIVNTPVNVTPFLIGCNDYIRGNNEKKKLLELRKIYWEWVKMCIPYSAF